MGGFVLWFTGLSGSGKSAVADRVAEKLVERGLKIERLDGDIVRKSLTIRSTSIESTRVPISERLETDERQLEDTLHLIQPSCQAMKLRCRRSREP